MTEAIPNKKINWGRLILEIITVVIGVLAGTQI
jgi:hypothetical protein